MACSSAEMEKGRNVWIELYSRRDTVLVVPKCLEHKLDNDAVWLCNKELEVNLKWKVVAVSQLGSMVNRQFYISSSPLTEESMT